MIEYATPVAIIIAGGLQYWALSEVAVQIRRRESAILKIEKAVGRLGMNLDRLSKAKPDVSANKIDRAMEGITPGPGANEEFMRRLFINGDEQ